MERALEVSTPSASRYGRHLSLAQINALVAPPASAVQSVTNWLTKAGVSSTIAMTGASDFMVVDTDVRTAEALLHATFVRYGSSDGSHTFTASPTGYTVPAELGFALDFVGGVTRAPPTPRASHRAVKTSSGSTSPDVLRELYQVNATAAVSGQGVQAVVSFLGDAVRTSDLTAFLSQYAPESPHTVARTIGPQDTSKCEDPACTESMLDSEYLMAIGRNVSTWVWAQGGTHHTSAGGDQEAFLAWLVGVGNMSAIPNVYSVSYADAEYTLGDAYVTRCNVELAKLAARGASVLAASGDYGVAGAPPVVDQCMDRFFPTFPASSPWVTAVGGTTGGGSTSSEIGAAAHERAWADSGGGFSDVAARPPWQAAAVQGYLSSTSKTQPLPPRTSWNVTGRAYPDVSARATDFTLVLKGASASVDGTSGACPTFAGIVALLNDARFAKGGQPLGFLNPLLYSNQHALVDIPNGANAGCGVFSTDGFGGAPGWDPVTGLGYPSFPSLLALV